MIIKSILISILVLILVLIIYIFSENNTDEDDVVTKEYVKKQKNGFGGIGIDELSLKPEFYKNKRQDTIKYLEAVYPMAKESLNKLSDLELASFYNSLWFYYNCKGEYTDNDLGSLTGKNDDIKWGPLPCKDRYPLPYTPQGWLYNFYTYNKYNVPEVYSDSDDSKIYLKLENATSNRPGIMGTYVNEKIRSSGIMWVIQRTIQRDVWYPNGLFNNKDLVANIPDNWQIVSGRNNQFNFPCDWYGKLGDYQYIEVTHSPSDTGDAINMSPFWWYNVSVGSGLFLNLGKTLAVKNKVSGIFEQSKLLAKTTEGQQVLKKFFNTIDPYEITWGIVGLCGYNSNTDQRYCDFSVQDCGGACNPNPIGYSQAANITFNNFYQETLNYQRNILKNDSKFPLSETIKIVIDLAVDNKNYFLAHVAEQLLPDETNFFLGTNLGLDTIQFYEDPNGNDNYVFEIIDLRIPDRFKADAKNRDYSGFMNIVNPNAGVWSTSARGNSYKQPIIDEYLKNAFTYNWLSIRDPFDINNEDKVKKCKGLELSKVCDGSYAATMYCLDIPLLNEYKCLQLGNEFNNNTCVLSGNNPTC